MTDEMPRFYAAGGGPAVSARIDRATEAAAVARAHWRLGGGGLLLARPPDDSLEVDGLIEEALTQAVVAGVRGGAVTPFVLARLHAASGGATLRANRDLVVANAALAAEVARAADAPTPT
jgi:pseudouridine-5'-phosphate glycosidase